MAVGSFNPTIINPDWLLRHGLINDADYESAEIEAIHPEVSRFALPWCNIEVLTNRFMISSNNAGYHDVLKDLGTGIWAILAETPITAIGLNVTYADVTEESSKLHLIGDALAPKEPWKKILPESAKHGLSQLSMRSERDGEIPGYISTRVRPIQKGEHLGIELLINNHYEIPNAKNSPGSVTDAASLIDSQWQSAQACAQRIHNGILTITQ